MRVSVFWCRRHASDDGMDTFRHIDVLLIMNSRIGKLKISWTVVDWTWTNSETALYSETLLQNMASAAETTL